MTEKRKLPAMHEAYGITPTPHKCRECSNLLKVEYHGKGYYKCAAYGVSNSEATDWGVNYRACGFFNIPTYNMMPLFEQHKHKRRKSAPIPIDGQVLMEV